MDIPKEFIKRLRINFLKRIEEIEGITFEEPVAIHVTALLDKAIADTLLED